MATFKPRLNQAGMLGSRYWYTTTNPFYPDYGLPNCTCYAWGRFWEISDPLKTGENIPHLPTGNAKTWYNSVSGYNKGQTPKLGAILCLGANVGVGHVAIVEQILENNVIITSNSAWNGQYFYTQILTPDTNGKYHTQGSQSTYESQGFIYNPFVNDDPEPTTKKDNFPWVLYAHKLRNPL